MRWKRNKYYIFWVCVCSLSYSAYNVYAPYYVVICGLSVSTSLVGALAKLSRETITFVICVCLSVRPFVRTEHPGSHRSNFHIWYLILFRISVEKIQFSSKSEKQRVFCMEDLCTIMTILRSVLLRSKIFLARVVQKIKTEILCSVPISPEIVPFMR